LIKLFLIAFLIFVMSTECNTANKNIDDAPGECDLNIQRRHSFLAPNQIGLVEYSKCKEEDHGSISSESTSAGLPTVPMSTTESTVEDESFSNQSDPNIAYCTSHAYQMPMMQPAGTQVYQQPLIYNQPLQFQQSYNFWGAQQGQPSFGYAPQLQPIPMNVPLTHQVQRQQVYPMHQYQQIPQDWVRVPVSSTAVPCMVGPVLYQQSNPGSSQVSPVVASSNASTPVVSSFSTPCYSNYGFFNTPVRSSASCTPIHCPTAYPDVPPVLNLTNNQQCGSLPQRISCNINTLPVSSEWTKAADSSTFECHGNTSVKQAKMTSSSSVELLEKTEKEGVKRKEEENVWLGSCNYDEYCYESCSNLFVTWSGSKAELVEKLQNFKLEVRDVLSTSDENVRNVIFESHPIARKAFTMQHLIRLRIVPPKNSHRIWMRNPSPKFLVKFETKCRLVVRKGKAECHDIVGELLKGCLITADQLKGHRIRVVCCQGSFMFPGGKIVEMKGVRNKSDEKASLGWISYRCKYTKESLVIRRSWNTLSDYIYDE